MQVPTYREIFESIQSDIRNRFGLTSLIGKAVFNAFAAVQAGKIKLLYVSAGFIYKNIFPDLADPQARGGTLERFGSVKLGRLPYPAVAGVYSLTVTGDIGGVIPAGNKWYKQGVDFLYTNDAEIILTATTQDIEVRALRAGSEAALQVGEELNSVSPLLNVNDAGFIAAILTPATEAETYEDYRAKVIEAFQTEPQGGAKTDFRAWGKDAAGVRQIYPYVRSGAAGEVDLYVEATPGDSTDGHGTPPQSMLDEVCEVVEFDPDTSKPLAERGRRPMGVFDVHCLAVVPAPVDVQIFGLSDTGFLPDIEAALEEYVYGVRPFIDGADNPNNKNIDKLFVGDIITLIRGIIGAENTFTNVKMFVSGVEYVVFQFSGGSIPYVNNVSNTLF